MAQEEYVSIHVLDAAKRLQDFCVERGWRFCFIGGLAFRQGRSNRRVSPTLPEIRVKKWWRTSPHADYFPTFSFSKIGVNAVVHLA